MEKAGGTAIGTNSSNQANGAVAVGTSSLARASEATAIDAYSRADVALSTVLGVDVVALSQSSIAIGDRWQSGTLGKLNNVAISAPAAAGGGAQT